MVNNTNQLVSAYNSESLIVPKVVVQCAILIDQV
jgi:hypothetical protein